jgi:hypothetical protein
MFRHTVRNLCPRAGQDARMQRAHGCAEAANLDPCRFAMNFVMNGNLHQ